ncbi:MAG: O-antigen ligase family protein [Calothrix sp. MO_192.B10]|nr:O-antigen ligase family protein [Calothrix sp. MO_192.B10]
MIFYFVVSKIDPITLESVYGENDPKFAGVYQYLGDTFALVSMILASKILVIKKIPPTDLILKKVKNSHQYLRLNFVIFILISSVAVLFFNGSRASFFCFILVVPYLIFDSFVKWFDLRKMIFVCLLLVSSIYVVKITNNLPNFDSSTVLFSNRNLSAVETGSDASLDERLYYYDLGIQDIIKNPIFGNYSERIIQRGSGTYIHNLLATFQNFGFPAFLSYLSLIIICIKQFLNSWKSFNDSECMLFNSLLIFNVVQILGFRQPLGFYVIFVNFGLALRRLSKHRLNL